MTRATAAALLFAAAGYAPAADPFAEPIGQAVQRGQLPGAVVLVVRNDAVLHRAAYGLRARQPAETPMTADTVFDLASLTKPVATATSVFILIERGKLALADPVARHWPAFAANGKAAVTIEHLLLHTSGLTADNSLKDYADGRAKALERVAGLKLEAEPGKRFRYSDVGFIVLGHLVETLSGQPLDEFAQQHIFKPLKMTDTRFGRAAGLAPAVLARVAPTEKADGAWLAGTVHDPRARAMGGVAGHAGLFSTADDLSRFCRMILRGGELDGVRVLKPDTVKLLTDPQPVPGGLRTRGWDCDTTYSANRGGVFPKGRSFGHTGFTGTSLWLDPGTKTAVIFLSNRVHPDGKGNVTKLRGDVATLAAEAFEPGSPQVSRPRQRGEVSNGIDVLAAEKFARLNGKRVGLVTNHTGRALDGESTIDLLHRATGVKLVALFSPEHGIRGAADEKVGDTRDEKTGLPVFSLYGQRRKPDADSLKGIDTLVYDIQDVGCRFYTYISTLGLVLEAAAQHRLKLIVLDRPNPVGGLAVAGPVLDAGKESFVGWHRLPVRHGLTVGELARLFNAERKLGVDLEVVTMQGWRRGQLFDATGQTWVNPSPNMRSLTAALLYPGVGLLETTNVSVGRGTERPFEWVGAPWLDGPKVAAALTAQRLPGLRFVPVTLTPASSVHAGKPCGGVQIFIDDWSKLEPVSLGIAVALTLRQVHPADWQPDRFDRLLGHGATFEAVKAGRPLATIVAPWREELDRFEAVRRQYLFYD